MCNLYTTKASADEVADAFRARKPAEFNAGPGEVYPGYPGMVVRHERGERILQAMTWGFPLRLKGAKPESKPRPVNNARTDKLDSFMWKFSFLERRCLIPLTAFAEAEGEKGRMTRTWFSLPDEPIFAAAGIWKDSPEWGPVYSMIMTEACIDVADVHDRMPVILKRADWDDWLDGPPDAAGLLCRPYPDLVVVDRTTDPWRRQAVSLDLLSWYKLPPRIRDMAGECERHLNPTPSAGRRRSRLSYRRIRWQRAQSRCAICRRKDAAWSPILRPSFSDSA